MSIAPINLNIMHKILSNSGFIQYLELQRRERKNPTIRLFDHHDIFMVIFIIVPYIVIGSSIILFIYTLIFGEQIKILFNIIHYSVIFFIISFILYNILTCVIDGNPFNAHKEWKRLLEEDSKRT
jgi:hypothetical protein